jgi:alpha-galactosidase
MTSLVREIATHRLDGAGTTIVFAWTDGVPWIVHFGRRLPAGTDLATLARLANRPLPNGTVDVDEAVSLHPEAGRAFKGQPALSGWRPGEPGAWAGRFSFQGSETLSNGILFRLADKSRGLALELECRIDPLTDVAEFVSRLTNEADTEFAVEWLSAPVIAPGQEFCEAISFHGRWCGEFALARTQIEQGLRISENRTGRTSHGSFPGMIFTTPVTGEEAGECIGLHLGWSGNHRLVLERLSTGDTQVQMGVLFIPGEIRLAPGECMETPPLYATYSADGLNRMSQNLHAHVRAHILKFPVPEKPRPVTVNTWEAIYFNHTEERLKEIVDAAAEIGAERFVIDDGWFSGRNDDTSSLGDWFADPAKYPGGLQPIAEYVRSKDMEFGLWVEPEMVNEQSELFRNHPDWVLRLREYPLITGRNQFVLDISRREVADYLFDRLSTLVSEHDIAYFKWDMNRDLILPGGPNGDAAAHRQVSALYRLIDRLHDAFPAGSHGKPCGSRMESHERARYTSRPSRPRGELRAYGYRGRFDRDAGKRTSKDSRCRG